MKIPIRPPDFLELFRKNFEKDGEACMAILQSAKPVNKKGEYLHWDKLIHLEPPNNLTSETWWVSIKAARNNLFKTLKIRDKDKQPFKIVTPDKVLRELHWLDVNAAGSISSELPINNPQMKTTYLIRSFVEEAINSSQLEGASTTRNVAKEMIRQGRTPQNKDEQMILNNYHAMQFIKEYTFEKLTPSMILGLHKILTEKTLDDPAEAGRYRKDTDDIRVVDGQGQIVFTPPPASQINEKIAKICDFANNGDLDFFIHPIIRAILLHFFLAYLHPFVDGNGRTARALFYWSVAHQGYWLMEFLSISRIIKQAPSQYGRAFLYTETDDNDTTYFVIHQLEIIKKAFIELQSFINKKVDDIKFANNILARSAHLKNRLNHRQLSLLRHALKYPGNIYTIKGHQNTHGIVYETARTDLIEMAEKYKLLTKQKKGKSFVFMSPTDLRKRISTAT